VARTKLFDYAVLYHPTPTKDQAGNDTTPDSELITISATPILAKDEKEVAMKAARAVPESYADKLDRVEVIVRPF
jgi:hypothetical protein